MTFDYTKYVDKARTDALNLKLTSYFMDPDDEISSDQKDLRFTPMQMNKVIQDMTEYLKAFNLIEVAAFMVLGKIEFIKRQAQWLEMVENGDQDDELDMDMDDDYGLGDLI